MNIESDPFGLEAEKKILRSDVRNVFTPHSPVSDLNLFFGRQQEVKSLIGYLTTPGQHALLFGNRGVGKSSLANITAHLILKHFTGGQIIIKKCDSNDSFASVVGEALEYVGIDISETSKSKSTKAGINNIVSISKDSSSSSKGHWDLASSPSWVSKKLHSSEAIFVIDEFDTIEDEQENKKMAELIKLLSDYGGKFKILLVGIAETAEELTKKHPSVARCLKEVKLNNMSNQELKKIIIGGANRLKLAFKPEVIKKIISLSSGYPHFTQLLALKSAQEAVVEERKEISLSDLSNALDKSINDAEGTLRKNYFEAVRSTKEDYSKILLAAALCKADEIEAKDIREKYKELYDTDISQGKLNNYFKRLVADDHTCILRRIAKGIYKFTDPRMPSFVKIAQKHLEN